MPAGAPTGLDRRFLLAKFLCRNTGPSGLVFFKSVARNPNNGSFFFTANAVYAGLMTDGIFGIPIESANAPPGGASRSANFNSVDGGWICITGVNDVFRNDATISGAWTNITPAAGVSRAMIVAYNGNLLIGGFSGNVEVSSNNGVSYSSPGVDTGLANLNGIVTNVDETRLIAYDASGDFAFYTAKTITDFNGLIGTTNNGNRPLRDAAISDDGRKAVVVGEAAGLATTDDFVNFPAMLPENNPFQSSIGGGGIGGEIDAVEYVSALGGFVLISTQGGPFMGFIDETDMSQCFAGSVLIDDFNIDAACGVTDGVQVMFPGQSGQAYATLRQIGQLSTE